MTAIRLTILSLLLTGFASAQGEQKSDLTQKAGKPGQAKTAQSKPESPKKVDPTTQLKVALKNAAEEAKYLKQIQTRGGLLSRFKRNRKAAQEMAQKLTPAFQGPRQMRAPKKFIARLMGDAEKGSTPNDVVFMIGNIQVKQAEFDAMSKYLNSYPQAEASGDVRTQAIAALVRAHAGEAIYRVSAHISLDRMKVIAKQLSEGASFAELANSYSSDTETAAKGGKRSYLARKDVDKTYAKAAFGLKVGQVSGIVRTAKGYHLIRLLAKKKGASADLDQVLTSHIFLPFSPTPDEMLSLASMLKTGSIDVAFRKDELRKFCPASFK
jgi:hypothetical protein